MNIQHHAVSLGKMSSPEASGAANVGNGNRAVAPGRAGRGGKCTSPGENPLWNTLCHSIVVEVDVWTTPR
jgi:hypothetical protein